MQSIYTVRSYFMIFIMNESNIGHVDEELQNDDVATLIIMTNIIHHYDSV